MSIEHAASTSQGSEWKPKRPPLKKGSAEHRALVDSLRGKYPNATSSDEYARQKQEEIDREDRIS